MPICDRCGELFKRKPVYKRKSDALVHSRAKLCSTCRKLSYIERTKKQKLKLAELKGGNIKTMAQKSNPWMEHLKRFRREHPELKGKEAVIAAKKTYKK
jgi:hypothetical protein